MSRCVLRARTLPALLPARLLATCVAAMAPALALAQAPTAPAASAASAPSVPLQRQGHLQRDFPRDALRGELVVTQPPLALINGRDARLAPGARIRGQNNIIVLSAGLVGHKLLVHYTVDFQGLVKDVWILRPDEASRPWPSTREEAGTWAFDPPTRTWTQR